MKGLYRKRKKSAFLPHFPVFDCFLFERKCRWEFKSLCFPQLILCTILFNYLCSLSDKWAGSKGRGLEWQSKEETVAPFYSLEHSERSCQGQPKWCQSEFTFSLQRVDHSSWWDGISFEPQWKGLNITARFVPLCYGYYCSLKIQIGSPVCAACRFSPSG